MASVTSVENKGRLVEICLDERLFCTVDAKTFERFPLQAGAEVDGEAYLDKVASFQSGRAYEQALSLLDLCDRTERQLLGKLLRRGFVPGAAQAAVDRLKEKGLVDDAAYARRLVEMESSRAVGRYAMQRKLFQKGVGSEDAEAALSCLTGSQQRDACLEAAMKLCRRYRGEEIGAARRKLGQALARRGFRWDDVAPALDKALGGDTQDDD